MTIADNIAHLNQRIEAAANQAKRDPKAITLIAISKQRTNAEIQVAYDAGLRHFGENRTSELEDKATALAHLPDIHWHFIAPLQSRQTPTVATHAQTFHALDRLKIATRLNIQRHDPQSPTPNPQPPLHSFIQVNISGETTKSGLDLTNWESNPVQTAALTDFFDQLTDLENINPIGLMTMAPYGLPPDQLRPIFQRTQALAHWVNTNTPHKITALSMGMTDDFEIAIEEGATDLRLGRAIFNT